MWESYLWKKPHYLLNRNTEIQRSSAKSLSLFLTHYNIWFALCMCKTFIFVAITELSWWQYQSTHITGQSHIYAHTNMCIFNDTSRESKLQGENAAFKLTGQTKEDEAKSPLSCPLCLHLNQCTMSTEQEQTACEPWCLSFCFFGPMGTNQKLNAVLLMIKAHHKQLSRYLLATGMYTFCPVSKVAIWPHEYNIQHYEPWMKPQGPIRVPLVWAVLCSCLSQHKAWESFILFTHANYMWCTVEEIFKIPSALPSVHTFLSVF